MNLEALVRDEIMQIRQKAKHSLRFGDFSFVLLFPVLAAN